MSNPRSELAVIYSTGVANSSAMGLDVGTSQAVAVRFSPSTDTTATEMELSLMSNGPNATIVAQILQGGTSAPANTPIGGSRPFHVKAVDWQPEQQAVTFEEGVKLKAGQLYWIVLRSSNAMGKNGVWLLGAQHAWSTTTRGATWQRVDQEAAAPGVILRGTTNNEL